MSKLQKLIKQYEQISNQLETCKDINKFQKLLKERQKVQNQLDTLR